MSLPAVLLGVGQLALHHAAVRGHDVERHLGDEPEDGEKLVCDVEEGEGGGVGEAVGALLEPTDDTTVLE